jgi:hypothetical protein
MQMHALETVLAGQYSVESGIVCQHRKHNLSVSSGSSGRLRQGSAGIHKRPGLVGGAIPNRHLMSGAHQIGGDRRAHIAKAEAIQALCCCGWPRVNSASGRVLGAEACGHLTQSSIRHTRFRRSSSSAIRLPRSQVINKSLPVVLRLPRSRWA